MYYFDTNTHNRFSGGIFSTHPTEYTMAAWVYAGDNGFRGIFTRSNNSPSTAWSHCMWVNNYTFNHYTYDGSARQVAASSPVAAGSTNHVVCTALNGTGVFLYLNGKSTGNPTGLGTLWTGGNDWWIGADNGSTTGNFYGYLYEVAIWYKYFTPAEVRELYRQVRRGPLQFYRNSLALYLPMETNKSFSAVSGNWYDGVNGGFTQTTTGTAYHWGDGISYP